MLKEKKEAELREILGEDYDPPTVSGACANPQGAAQGHSSSGSKTYPPKYCDNSASKSPAAAVAAGINSRRKTYVVSPAGFKTHPNTPNVDTGASDISGRIGSGGGARAKQPLPRVPSTRTTVVPKTVTTKTSSKRGTGYGDNTAVGGIASKGYGGVTAKGGTAGKGNVKKHRSS